MPVIRQSAPDSLRSDRTNAEQRDFDADTTLFDALEHNTMATMLKTWFALNKPAAPVNLTLTSGDGEITGSFEGQAGVLYQVYSGASSGERTTLEGTLQGAPNVTFTVDGLTSGTLTHLTIVPLKGDATDGIEGDAAQGSATPLATTAPNVQILSRGGTVEREPYTLGIFSHPRSDLYADNGDGSLALVDNDENYFEVSVSFNADETRTLRAQGQEIGGNAALSTIVSKDVTYTPQAGVKALRSDALVEAAGFAVHPTYPRYDSWDTGLEDLIVDGGVRFVRTPEIGTAEGYARVQSIIARGVKIVLVISPRDGLVPENAQNPYWTQSGAIRRELGATITDLGAANVKGVVCLNEPDIFFFSDATTTRDPVYRNDAAETAATPLQKSDPDAEHYLVDYVKEIVSDTAAVLASYPDIMLIGPSYAARGSRPNYYDYYAETGDLSAELSHSNWHPYQEYYHPGHAGLSSPSISIGFYNSYKFNDFLQSIQGSDLPRAADEWGYSTTILPEPHRSRYVIRGLLSQHYDYQHELLAAYELVSVASPDPANAEHNFGWLNADLTTTPSWDAFVWLMGKLSDPGASFTPTRLDFTLSGDTANVKSALYQKADGTHQLFLWVEASSYDGTNAVTVPTQDVTVTFGEAHSLAETLFLADTPAVTQDSANTLTLTLSDAPTLLEIAEPVTAGSGALQELRFEEAAGATTFADSSGNDRPGTLAGSSTNNGVFTVLGGSSAINLPLAFLSGTDDATMFVVWKWNAWATTPPSVERPRIYFENGSEAALSQFYFDWRQSASLNRSRFRFREATINQDGAGGTDDVSFLSESGNYAGGKDTWRLYTIERVGNTMNLYRGEGLDYSVPAQTGNLDSLALGVPIQAAARTLRQLGSPQQTAPGSAFAWFERHGAMSAAQKQAAAQRIVDACVAKGVTFG